ncbi:tetratricopeptide repeat protein [Roseivirga sp. BDSF3-8]|uniref:tetratricopeptide repeat protein n=1 Tax=Roseivirga sp. BDSF3-8 TaxID=3241598 RepID=UPI0035320469
MKKLIPVILFSLITLGCTKDNLEEELPSSSPQNEYIIVDQLLAKAKKEFDKDPDKALELTYAALEQAEGTFYLKGEQKSHNVLHWLYLNKFENYDKAGNHHEEYQRVTQELKETKDLALLNYKKGYTLFKSQNLAEAVPYLFEARDLYLAQGDLQKEAYSLYAISKIFERVGKYEDGLYYLNKSSFDVLDDRFLWTVYQLQGKLYLEAGELSESLGSYKKSFEIVSSLDLPSKELKVLNDLARVSIMLDKTDLADGFIEQGISLAKSLDDQSSLCLFYLKKGYRYQKTGNFSDAITWNQKAKSVSIDLDNEEYQAMAYLALSHCFYEVGQIEKALQSAYMGLDISPENSSETRKNLLNNYSLYSKETGDFTTYFEYQNMLKDIEIEELKHSEYADVHKAELAYKDKLDARDHEAYIQSIQKEIATDERQGRFYLMGLGGVILIIIIAIAIYRPYKFFMSSAARVVHIMEDLQVSFRKRLAGQGPVFPHNPPSIKRPVPPDERDLHNLWKFGRRADRGKKGNDDEGTGDDPTTDKD